MLTIQYYTAEDVFYNTKFITAEADTTEENLKRGFKAIKKYDASLFIKEDITAHEQHGTRYNLHDCFNTGSECMLTKVKTTWFDGVQNEEPPVLIDYKTALRQELKNLKEGVTHD